MSNRTFLAVAISTCVVALGCSTATHSLTGETAGVSGASAPGGTGGRDAGAGGMGGSGSGGTIGSGMRGCPGVGGTSPPPCPQTILSIMSYLASCTPGLACTFPYRAEADFGCTSAVSLVCCDDGLVFLPPGADCSAVTETAGPDPRCSTTAISAASSCSDEGLECTLEFAYMGALLGGKSVRCCAGQWIDGTFGNSCPPVDGGGIPADGAID